MSYHDTAAGAGGGSNGNGAADNTGASYGGATVRPFTKFAESPFQWTDPPRWFKANDPYWYKIDNLPLKQIHENCQWLKDQLQVALLASGVDRVDFNELKPYAVGSDRKVRVLPGNYLGRVNDAYGKGITTYNELRAASIDVSPEYLNVILQREVGRFPLRDKVLASLVGYDVQASSSFPSNGLYDYLQHHQVTRVPQEGLDYLLGWKAGQSETNPNNKTGMANIPKIKLAIWRRSARSWAGEWGDLQQRAMYFTRKWGGVSRTSMVNIPEPIAVQVPAFNSDDYINSSDYIPHVRIDLVFIYTHPVDAKKTTLAAADGNSPVTITSPTLGIVKGAGIINLKNQGTFPDSQVDIQANPALTDSDTWIADSASRDVWYDSDGQPGYSEDESAWQIRSPLSDQIQEITGLEGRNIHTSFPSPDDLLNLAPLIQNDLEEEDLALIGQSILPVAYVLVRKDAALVDPSDVIDIRPFFRTAELTYNERAGVAAAMPPLSLGNPAVGKIELDTTLDTFGRAVGKLVSDVSSLGDELGDLEDTISDLSTSSLTNAFVFGNVSFGPASWEFQKRRGGGGSTFGYNKFMKLSVDVPNKNAVGAQVVITQKAPNNQHHHHDNDGDQRYKASLQLREGSQVVKQINSADSATMGWGHNGDSWTLNISPIRIPDRVNNVRLRISHTSNLDGDNENEDTVAGDVEAWIILNNAIHIESNDVEGS